MSVTLQECVDGAVRTRMRSQAIMPTAGYRGNGKDCGKVRARATVRQGLGQGLAYIPTYARQALRAIMYIDSAELWCAPIFT